MENASRAFLANRCAQIRTVIGATTIDLKLLTVAERLQWPPCNAQYAGVHAPPPRAPRRYTLHSLEQAITKAMTGYISRARPLSGMRIPSVANVFSTISVNSLLLLCKFAMTVHTKSVIRRARRID
jgi:hypothetical protein